MAMSWLSNLFGGGDSPMDAANQYLNQIPGVAHQGYDPYVNAGMDASSRTKGQYESLLSDPTAFINKLMEGYKPSEGYQFQKEQLNKELSNTAAAGGIAGTPLDQMNQGQAVQKLLSGDMQQFLKNVLGEYHTGLAGEEGIASRGVDASGRLTDLLGNNLASQSGLAYKNQVDKNQRKSDLWSMFGKALGAGTGAFLGGVPGAKVGSSIFS
jgi:hypothetical protein